MSQNQPPEEAQSESESAQYNANSTEQDIHNAGWLTLSRDEQILWWGHPSLIPHMPVIFTSILAVIFGIAATFALDFGYTPLLLVPAGIIGAVSDYLRVITTFYVVTDDKVVKKVGVIRRDTLEVRYENIEHCRAMQNIGERLLSYGDIELATAGTGLAEVILDDVREPRRVTNLINQKKDDAYNSLRGPAHN